MLSFFAENSENSPKIPNTPKIHRYSENSPKIPKKKKVFSEANISYRYRIVSRKKAKYRINIVSNEKKRIAQGCSTGWPWKSVALTEALAAGCL